MPLTDDQAAELLAGIKHVQKAHRSVAVAVRLFGGKDLDAVVFQRIARAQSLLMDARHAVARHMTEAAQAEAAAALGVGDDSGTPGGESVEIGPAHDGPNGSLVAGPRSDSEL